MRDLVEFGFAVVPWLMGAVLLFFPVALWWLSPGNVRKRRLRAQPLVEIAAVEGGGAVRITGTVVAVDGQTLEAPLTERPCVAYRVLVKRREYDGERYVTEIVADDIRSVNFIVDDGTGQAFVIATTARWHLPLTSQDPRTRAVGQYVKARGMHESGSESFSEGVLEAGESVTVLGLARWETDPGGSQRGGLRDAPKRLVFETHHDSPLFISDDPSTLA